MNRDWGSIEPDDIDNDSSCDEQEYHDNMTDIGEPDSNDPDLDSLL